jgi:hypothetical protein
MLPLDAPELAYCRAALLPIWETWVAGDTTMRRALDRRVEDPAGLSVACERLIARVWSLLCLEADSTAASAALQAGWAGGAGAGLAGSVPAGGGRARVGPGAPGRRLSAPARSCYAAS